MKKLASQIVCSVLEAATTDLRNPANGRFFKRDQVFIIAHVSVSLLPRQYGLYQSQQLQFNVFRIMLAIDTGNMKNN
jgi:hypothetical protein